MNLRSCYLFRGLSPSQLEKITAITREQQFFKGQWLYHEDQKAEHIYMLKAGVIELITKVEDSIEIPVTVIRPKNGCVGVGALVEPYLYSLSARCIDDSTVYVIKQTNLGQLMGNDPEMRCTIMTNLAQKMFNRLKETRQEVKIHFMNLVRSVTF